MNTTIADIVKNNLCTGCGLCVSESMGSLKMEWDEYGFLVPVQIEEKVPQQAVRVCPFNPNPEVSINDEDKLAEVFLPLASCVDSEIGKFENTYIGYCKEFRKTSSSGGIATYIFKELLSQKYVEHLFVVKEVNGSYEYQLFNSIDDIVKISKTRYIPVTLEKLFSEIEVIEGRVAVSGVACFIKAIRLKQYYNPDLKEKIPFLVGIICGGLKSKFFTDFLAQSSGVIGEYRSQEYRIKDEESSASDYSFGAYDSKEQFHQLKMRSLGDMWGTGLFKSRACDFCTDVLTELADISLGDAWLPEYNSDGLGTSVIVTRTKIADKLIQDGISGGDLVVNAADKQRIVVSQKPSFSHRRNAIRFRFEKSKDKGLITPYIRKRVQKDISLPFKIVQVIRNETRLKSLEYWREFKELRIFNKKIQFELKKLSLVTKIYHKLR